MIYADSVPSQFVTILAVNDVVSFCEVNLPSETQFLLDLTECHGDTTDLNFAHYSLIGGHTAQYWGEPDTQWTGSIDDFSARELKTKQALITFPAGSRFYCGSVRFHEGFKKLVSFDDAFSWTHTVIEAGENLPVSSSEYALIFSGSLGSNNAGSMVGEGQYTATQETKVALLTYWEIP